MPDNAFIGKPEPPIEPELAEALGPAKKLWDRFVKNLARKHGVTEEEWKAYSKNSGWTFRLKREGRTIVYLSPYRGSFLAAFTLGDRAVAGAHDSDLPEWVKETIREASRYAEGTAVRIEVKQAKDVAAVEALAVIKLEH
jgi:hypothetical protein